MKSIQNFIHSPWLNLLFGFFLATLWAFFAMRHLQAFQQTGKYAFLIFCLSESLQALFFLARKGPKTVSTDAFDWLVAFGGTLAPLLVVPGGVVLWQHGEALVTFGVLLQMAGLLSLNRSFAIVAAKRDIKTQGMYRFMRHPMYASYLFLFVGYLLFNASLINLVLLGFSLVFLFLRIKSEEEHLFADQDYHIYAERVRWRLIPFVY